ncbi:MBL fold metallo-hydrolase [Thermostichus vulcanus]|uniref:MBL fold metallo-hydrolase n=1 Tax=Thermostichus vulcanus str. 'Rupite' TaxID=2813851 RepID=A0ABT0CCZ3_THEVL|nr:MBL fold metallo-hydrolase [Thermostichus vulcanus]MCJ2543626.1 MBL fold metallo-hydrolase [Thermostichus vulcanus str. 'Rupite']
MKLTRIDLNSWLIQTHQQTLLLDPWLVDPLVFLGLPWFIRIEHRNPPPFTPETLPKIDGILISQAQPDHCHPPTLQRLDKTIPVLASPSAAPVVRGLGFASVQALDPWQSVQWQDVQITAVPGAPLGPIRELGYLLKEEKSQTQLYYEPHLSEPDIRQRLQQAFSPIQTLLIPVVGQVFPLLGEVIMGPERALQVVEALQPRQVIPTAMGEVDYSGWFASQIRTRGSLEEFRQRLGSLNAGAGISIQLCCPAPGETVSLSAGVEA